MRGRRVGHNMKEGFIGGGGPVWKAIRKLFGRGRKGDVAVAFLGRGSIKRLRLTRGSILIVNASLECVRCGQTDPKEILQYINKGVQVFNNPALHAKIFTSSTVAIVGSTNVSTTSEQRLDEAALFTSFPPAVQSARSYVKNMASAASAIGPEQARSLIEQYRFPQRMIRDYKVDTHYARGMLWAC